MISQHSKTTFPTRTYSVDTYRRTSLPLRIRRSSSTDRHSFSVRWRSFSFSFWTRITFEWFLMRLYNWHRSTKLLSPITSSLTFLHRSLRFQIWKLFQSGPILLIYPQRVHLLGWRFLRWWNSRRCVWWQQVENQLKNYVSWCILTLRN